MIFRLILSDWAKADSSVGLYDSLELSDLTESDLKKYNEQGYNCYFFPNSPSEKIGSSYVSGEDIDIFNFCFVDMDMKSGVYSSKKEFVDILLSSDIPPNTIIDSGNGIHAYWNVDGLDAKSFLRLQRRLCRKFNTDEAVAKLAQLMRVPNTLNVKNKDNKKLCEVLHSSVDKEYTAEELNNKLPIITEKDEAYCELHYNTVYKITDEKKLNLLNIIPGKFYKLLKNSKEVKTIFEGNVADRSISDFRLACLLKLDGFSKEEAISVLSNTKKASSRSEVHRYNYAHNMVEKIWTEKEAEVKENVLSIGVNEILSRDDIEQRRLPNNYWFFDGTHNGCRLTEVLGLVGGAGSGKTTIALNYFLGFAEKNPEYLHLFVSLEQPEEEIAKRWLNMIGDRRELAHIVHVLGNYNRDGTYRNLSLDNIKDQVLLLEKTFHKKVGCVVIDHIGVLNKTSKNGEFEGIIEICHKMKAFAIETKTFLIMQSQTSRDKAGIGDIELDKDAAYGTTMFEWYVDYLVTTWQPLKRMYSKVPNMTITAFKYCKIRKFNILKDRVKQDSVYAVKFDPETERFRELTQDEFNAVNHLNKQCANERKKNRKTEPAPIDYLNQENTVNGK